MSHCDQGEYLVLQQLAALNLRRKGAQLYEPVSVTIGRDQVFMKSFKHFFIHSEADEFIDILCSMPEHSIVDAKWNIFVRRNAKVIAERMGSMNNTHLPVLRTDRYKISFGVSGSYDMVSFIYFLSLYSFNCNGLSFL
jgi:hypothetical protein